MANERRLPLTLFDLRTVKPLMKWEDIKVGEEYHLPPLIYNKRMDFTVSYIDNRTLRYSAKDKSYVQTMFRTDVSSRFIVKKQK